MDKWTVALYGHKKVKYYIRRKTTSLDEASFVEVPVFNDIDKQWECGLVEYPEKDFYLHEDLDYDKRAKPGDVVSFKPFDREYTWTAHERSSFLVVTVEGPTEKQMQALCEPYYDLNSYETYDPMSFNQYRDLLIAKANAALDPDKANAVLQRLGFEGLYDEYIEAMKDRSSLPRLYLKKRRFHITINDLKSLGVDEEKMLDKELFYNPNLRSIQKTECFDKLNSRYVLESDGLNLIQPVDPEEG